jgi:hypothetical protein
MGALTATKAVKEVAFRSVTEAREVLQRLLERVDADERIGPVFRAAHARTRFECTDLDLALNVASRLDDSEHCIEWSFEQRPPWSPKLTFVMSSAVVNIYLQGRESLPVLIARGRVRCKADSRAALLFLPTARLLVKPYRELVEAEYPHLMVL